MKRFQVIVTVDADDEREAWKKVSNLSTNMSKDAKEQDEDGIVGALVHTITNPNRRVR